MATRYHVERRIDAPPEKVWSILTEASRYRDWNKAGVSVEGTIAPGNTIALVSIANPKRTFNLHVTEMSAPNRMVWSDGMPLGLFKGERTYLVQARDGVTHFEMTEVYTGLLAPLFTKAIPDLTESFNLFADSLKAAAESNPAYVGVGELRDGRVAKMTEYFANPFEAPARRADFVEKM